MTSIPYKMACRDYCTVAERNTLPRNLSVYFFQILTFLKERLNFTNIKEFSIREESELFTAPLITWKWNPYDLRTPCLEALLRGILWSTPDHYLPSFSC